MRCAKKGCDADALKGSNYCAAHQPPLWPIRGRLKKGKKKRK